MSVVFAPSRVSLSRAACARPCLATKATRSNVWLPGVDVPSHLDGSIPGDYGFDPLKLGETNMDRLRESELIHCRWAMAGVAGCLVVELFGYGNWFDAPLWAVQGGQPTYFGATVPVDVKTILLVELIAMAGVEILRNEEGDAVKRKYPGGAFDPLGFSNDESKLLTMKKKELANGRLAMVAFLGFVAQHEATGKGPLANLGDHLSNPGYKNFATNGISLPSFAFPFLFEGASDPFLK